MNSDEFEDGRKILQDISDELNHRLEEDGYLILPLDEFKTMLGIKPNPGDELFGYRFYKEQS